MNPLDIKTWSERQQILAVIMATGAIIFALWFFIMYPKNKERLALESRIASQRNRLAQRGLLMDEDALNARLKREQDYRDVLLNEWRQTAARLGGFPGQTVLMQDQVSKIDFKVELFNARQAVHETSQATGIELPYDLGMEEAVHSNEDARKLMLQLRTVKTMADMLLGLKVSQLGQIEPLEPIQHMLPDLVTGYIEEFPVRMEFYGSLENVYALFSSMMQLPHVFFLKNLRVESAALDKPGLLRINATLSMLLFTRDPADLPAVPAARTIQPVLRRF